MDHHLFSWEITWNFGFQSSLELVIFLSCLFNPPYPIWVVSDSPLLEINTRTLMLLNIYNALSYISGMRSILSLSHLQILIPFKVISVLLGWKRMRIQGSWSSSYPGKLLSKQRIIFLHRDKVLSKQERKMISFVFQANIFLPLSLWFPNGT